VAIFAGAESHPEPPVRTYDVEVYRDGPWYMIRIPDLDGLTHARHPGEIEDMARSYIAVSTDLSTPLRCTYAIDVGNHLRSSPTVGLLVPQQPRPAQWYRGCDLSAITRIRSRTTQQSAAGRQAQG